MSYDIGKLLNDIYGGCAGTKHDINGESYYCFGDGNMFKHFIIESKNGFVNIKPKFPKRCICKVKANKEELLEMLRNRLGVMNVKPNNIQNEVLKQFTDSDIYLWGKPQSGKTTAAYFVASTYFNDMECYIGSELREKFRDDIMEGKKLNLPGLLFWDDADKTGTSEAFKERVWLLINMINPENRKNRFIITSNVSPENLVRKLELSESAAISMLERIKTRMKVINISEIR